MFFLAKISFVLSQAFCCFKAGRVPSREGHRTTTEMKRHLERRPVKCKGGIILFGVGETERSWGQCIYSRCWESRG